MKLVIKKGKTSKLIELFIQDSSSTTGAGLTGLVYNSAGLTAYYYRSGAASATAITLATMTVGTWASGGFKEIDATNMPGWYQLGVPDAALASGAETVGIHLMGATNMAPLPLEIQLTDEDLAGTGGGGAPSAATIADAVCDELLSGHTTAGTVGKALSDSSTAAATVATNLDTTVSSRLASSSISLSSGKVTVGTNDDKTGYALTSGERDSIAAALFDLTDGIETGLTLRQALRLTAAAVAAKLSGAATTTITIRNAVADSKNRITATVDSDGNRSAIVYDLT